jgi:hypothetical protein
MPSASHEELRLLAVVGLSPGATPDEIREARKIQARIAHSDRMAGESEKVRQAAETRMKDVNAACDRLLEIAREREAQMPRQRQAGEQAAAERQAQERAAREQAAREQAARERRANEQVALAQQKPSRACRDIPGAILMLGNAGVALALRGSYGGRLPSLPPVVFVPLALVLAWTLTRGRRWDSDVAYNAYVLFLTIIFLLSGLFSVISGIGVIVSDDFGPLFFLQVVSLAITTKRQLSLRSKDKLGEEFRGGRILLSMYVAIALGMASLVAQYLSCSALPWLGNVGMFCG